MVVDSKVLFYPVLWVFTKAVAQSAEQLIKHVLLATAARYVVNISFTSLAHIDSISYQRRIIDKNPPAKQLARELDWDTPLVGSALAFLLVKFATPLLDDVTGLSSTSLALCFLGHYGLVEPLYYVFHLVLHWPKVYKQSHNHHHASVITESVSGTSHPLLETAGYLAIFSFPFLLPGLCGHFSYELIYIYFIYFDIMNCIGHCNFECVPVWCQWGPLRYIVYCSSYHSQHHTKFTRNYCLFCPVWDYIGGTVSAEAYALQRRSLSASPKKVSAVFLGHGFGWSSVLHLPMVSPYLSSQKQAVRAWMYPLFPFCALVALLCRVFRRACITMQRYTYEGLPCATWSIPLLAYHYMSRRERPYINTLLLKAIKDADEQGATHVGLGALNKAMFLNNGGVDLIPLLHDGCRAKVVHGNTLTAAIVFRRIRQRVARDEEIVFTGATSTVATPVVLRLLQEGYSIRILTRSVDRFNEIRRRAGPNGERLRQIERYEEGADCRKWVLGTAATRPLAGLVAPGTAFFEFAVPCSRPEFLHPLSVDGIAGMRVNPRLCDLTFCHDQSSDTMPACLAATIIHSLEGFKEHEVGEVDGNSMDLWLALAEKHGFDLGAPGEEHPTSASAACTKSLDADPTLLEKPRGQEQLLRPRRPHGGGAAWEEVACRSPARNACDAGGAAASICPVA